MTLSETTNLPASLDQHLKHLEFLTAQLEERQVNQYVVDGHSIYLILSSDKE